MSENARQNSWRPMNVAVAQGSKAEKKYRPTVEVAERAAVIGEAIVPGIHPTPEQDLIFHGGKTIQHLTYTNFYLGGAAAWDPSHITHIDQALAAAMTDAHLNNVIRQYFQNQPISTTFRPSQIIGSHQPAKFSQGDVEQLLRGLKTQGSLDGFDLGNTVFNFMLPRGTILTTDEFPLNAEIIPLGQLNAVAKPADASDHAAIPIEDEDSSLEGLGGYHGSIHINGHPVYYAIGVFSEIKADGSPNGIVVFQESWKNVVATFYHELCEARTDPDVEDAIKAGNDPNALKFLGWTSRKGEEIGDFPVFEANPLSQVIREVPLANGHGTVPVQFQYSNFEHRPEGPIAALHPLQHP